MCGTYWLYYSLTCNKSYQTIFNQNQSQMKQNISSKYRLWVLLCTILLSTNVFSQKQHVSIHLKNASLQHLFSMIERQADVHFSYQTGILHPSYKVSITRENATIASILDMVLPDYNLQYEAVSEKSIVITQQNSRKKDVRQQHLKKMTGIVVDDNGMPIIGATVMQQGTKNGTVTDIDGRFAIEAPEGCVLTVSYIGFEDRTVRARMI